MEKANDVSNWTDIELCVALSQSKSKAESAFTEIYNRYSNSVFAYILRTINNRVDAKDIFQEVFLKFFDTCKKGARVTHILPFLLRIARNICLNYFRDKKNTISFDEAFNLISNEIDIDKSEISELITNALALLDFQTREIFVLHHYQNMTFNEIASITGESLAFVKTRYYRGKEKLKNILMPYFKKDY